MRLNKQVIKELMADKELTIELLANKIYFSKETVRKWLWSNNKSVCKEGIEALEKLFEISRDKFMIPDEVKQKTVRNTDSICRIIIPKSVRKQLNINPYDMMEIYTDGIEVRMKKYEGSNHVRA